jgi:glycerophosphoryl diester phosphodiesterase
MRKMPSEILSDAFRGYDKATKGVRMVVLVGMGLMAFVGSAWSSRAWGQRIVAHRGASADAPENTLAAFRLAWQQGADGIEGDYHLSAEGQIVCIHDADTQRVAGKKLVVKETNYADLKKLDVGAWKGAAWRGETIPTLEEVLATVPEGKKVFIELKTGPEIVGPLADVLKHASLNDDQIVIISLDAGVIAACKRRMPQIKCHWLTDYKQQDDGAWSPTVDEVIATIRQSKADGLGTEAQTKCVDDQFIQHLREAGIDEFHVWTVDDPETARYFQRLGAWGITTNCPAKLRMAIGEP